MLVVVAIFGGIMGALLISFLVGKSSYLSADAYIQVQQEARRAFDNMVKELREGGNVNNNVSVTEVSPTLRLDFQIARGFSINDPPRCESGKICWGSDTTNGEWVHYLFNTTNSQNVQLVRCTTLNRTDVITNFTSCRVLANNVNVNTADPANSNSRFTYDNGSRTVTMRLQVSVTSQQLPGGSMGTTPAPLRTQVRLRNTS